MTDAEEAFRRVQDQLFASKEHRLLKSIEHFWFSLYIFNRNYEELSNALSAVDNRQGFHPINLPANQPQRKVYFHEVTRLLHNFVAASYTLIEHARTLYRSNYKPKQTFPDYEQEVARRFGNNPLTKFVQDLRNYLQHYQLPILTGRVSFKRGSGISQATLLNARHLLAWDRWSAPARRYIESTKGDIHLLGVVAEYHAHVNDFYEWMRTRLEEVHKDELEVVSRRIRRLNMIWGKTVPLKIKLALEHEHKSKWDLMNSFAVSGLLDPLAFRRIITQNETPELQANALIEEFQEFCELEEGAKEMLRQVLKKVAHTSLDKALMDPLDPFEHIMRRSDS